MDPYFADRVVWMLVGSLVGFVLGYVVRTLHDSKEEMDEVLEVVREIKDKLDADDSNSTEKRFHINGESGSIDLGFLKNLVIAGVVLITAFAAFSSQNASNNVRSSTECNRKFLAQTISALNERTTYTVRQSDAIVKLQKAQSVYLKELLVRPPKPDSDLTKALRTYVRTLTRYVEVTDRARAKVEANPFPTESELSKCLSD